jgi:hypothetical protein
MAASAKPLQPFFVYSHGLTALLASRASGYYQSEGKSKSVTFASVMLSSFHMARVRIHMQNGGEGNG